MPFTYAPRPGTPVQFGVSDTPGVVLADTGRRTPDGDSAMVEVRFVDGAVHRVPASGLRHYAPPTLDVAAEVRRLATLGVPEDVARPLITYVDRINEVAAERANTAGYGFRSFYGVDARATGGGKFLRIVMSDDPQQSVSRSVHSFVVKTTGDVVKPAGWAGPAKSSAAATKGQLLTKYNLKADLDQLLADVDPYGSYLYSA